MTRTPSSTQQPPIPPFQRGKKNKSRTLADSVRIRLTEEIVTGAHPPGSRLDETGIAARLNVSRTPVREALRQLASSGLVEWRPRQGATVARISLQEMVSLFEMMAEFEGVAGRLAARRMSDQERETLTEKYKTCEFYARRGDRENYHLANNAFHVTIYEGSHNHYLIAHASSLYERLAPYRLYELNRAGELMRMHDEHGRITEAIVQRDGELAYRLLKEHTSLDSDLLGDLMATLGDSRASFST